MLVGHQLGPFVIDKELGAGAMGAVYRGRYTKTGQVVAIKVMAPSLGTSNPNALARFEREAHILKQLSHPNIVRLFGIDKQHRYYAMEYIEGESLDKVQSRRGRLTWEEVVDLGQQLCAALQHAHEKGIVHRDLKPSNLMILPDGTLKLTDFGIAKDLDVTQLTGANATVGTASYMSPEQCRGERDLTFKSDLYSLGVVFYELVTGRKPFLAETAMDMFLMHVQGTFERPSRLVLDVPVWLDTLICQLLEKKPEQRPRDAAMVAGVLASIQEKVEAQQSAGVDAARSRLVDRPRGDQPPDETDREAARTLLGKKRRRKKKPFYQRVWFQALGLLVMLGVAVGLLALALRPPSAETLYAQAERLMVKQDPAAWEKARAGPIREYLGRYGDVPGPQTEQVRRWAEDVDVRECEDLLRRYRRSKDKALKVQAQTEIEEKAFQAVDLETAGNLAGAAAIWQQVRKEPGAERWGLLAARHLRAVQEIDAREEALLARLKSEVGDRGQEPRLEGPERLAFTALRAEHLGDWLQPPEPTGDLALALRLARELRDQAAGEPGQQTWYLLAARKVHQLDGKLTDVKDRTEHRKKLVEQALDQAERHIKDNAGLLVARALCMNVVALYADDTHLEKQVKQAREILQQLAPLSAPVTR